jgi:hypothetical protein
MSTPRRNDRESIRFHVPSAVDQSRLTPRDNGGTISAIFQAPRNKLKALLRLAPQTTIAGVMI